MGLLSYLAIDARARTWLSRIIDIDHRAVSIHDARY